MYDLTTAKIIHTLDTSTTRVQITDNITHILLRHRYFHLHDRL